MMSKRALIFGISGQDGTYLAELLLKKGYEVYGTSRDAQVANFRNLIQFGIRDRVVIESVAPNDFRSVLQTIIKVQPDEIYNLSGQSSVGLSFQQPVETFESISVATINIMEAIRFAGGQVKFYNACSGECFGETQQPAIEETPFRPRSPYGVAKAAAFWQVANYREAYGLFACSGILFNHESPLRPDRFVTRKIVKTACRIAEGKESQLRLGNISIRRDWGWAPEYIEAMWLMLQQEKPDDYIVATGETHLLSEFIETAFSSLNLDWQKFVISDFELYRPSDLASSEANPVKAAKNLNWKANFGMVDVVRTMVEQELAAGLQGDDVR
jgi:GDPmannose 4,6-dehydratase